MISCIIPYRPLPGREGRLERLRARLTWQAMRADGEVIISEDLEDERFSRARALNAGIRQAKGPWILACDIDVIVARDFVAKVTSCLTNLLPPLYAVFTVLEEGRPHYNPLPAWGSDIQLFDRDLWEQVGGYDEAYSGYGYEDADFFERCMMAGATRVELPITVWHDPHPKVAGIVEDLQRNAEIYHRRSL